MSQVSLNGGGGLGSAQVENGGQRTNGTGRSAPALGGAADPALAHASLAQPHSQRIHAPVQGMQEADVLQGNVRIAEDVPGMHRDGAQPLPEQEAAAIAGAEEVLDAVFRDLQQADGKELERRDRLISRALSRLPDDAPQALVSGLATAQAHLSALSTGRSMLAEMQAKAQGLRSAARENRPAMLEGMQSQWEALEMAEQELAAEEKTGTAAVRLFREDLAACKRQMAEMVGLAMEGLIPPGTNAAVRQGLLSAPLCGAIATLKLRTGAPLEDISRTIAQGMSAAQAVLNARDMEI